jgi:hypothetical protein
MIPFALMVKSGRYPKRAPLGTFVSRPRRAAFCAQRQLFPAGTLDGPVIISNSFLAQCPQKLPPHAKASTSSRVFCGSGAVLVIGIDIGRTNDTAAVHHEQSRIGNVQLASPPAAEHRQEEGVPPHQNSLVMPA